MTLVKRTHSLEMVTFWVFFVPKPHMCLSPPADADRVSAHLRAAGLPDGLAGVTATGPRLVDHMRHDKKASGGILPFLLARGIGRTFLDRSVDLADVAAFLDEEPRR